MASAHNSIYFSHHLVICAKHTGHLPNPRPLSSGWECVVMTPPIHWQSCQGQGEQVDRAQEDILSWTKGQELEKVWLHLPGLYTGNLRTSSQLVQAPSFLIPTILLKWANCTLAQTSSWRCFHLFPVALLWLWFFTQPDPQPWSPPECCVPALLLPNSLCPGHTTFFVFWPLDFFANRQLKGSLSLVSCPNSSVLLRLLAGPATHAGAGWSSSRSPPWWWLGFCRLAMAWGDFHLSHQVLIDNPMTPA